MTITTRRAWDGGFSFDFDTAGGDFNPVLASPPEPLPKRVIAAMAIDSVTIDGTQVTPNARTVEKDWKAYRIVVGGKDVTYFRGVQTPLPNYGLVTPLLWGSGQITFPQIHAALENPGHGDLAWLSKFARVKIQRLDADDNPIDPPDYLGFIADYQRQGRTLTCTLGGQATGRASMADRPVQIFPFKLDLGMQAIRGVRRLRLPVGSEPVTGISLTEGGGSSEMDNIADLLAKSTLRDGTQWTIMPNANGRYVMFQKDTTTIAASVYVDGAWVVPDLTRAFSEEPNRVWAHAVDDDGMRIRPAEYPGLTSFARPPFPGTLSPGDSGAAFEKLRWALFFLGYLDGSPPPDAWTTDPDDPITQAVAEVQDGALEAYVEGVVDEDTWNAVFDHDVTGYSLKGSREVPAAQKSYTKAFLTNASGRVLKRNPNFDRSKLLVDVTVDMGRASGQQLHKWAKREMGDDNTENWVGTITVNSGALIDGEHNPGDPLTSSDLRDVRSLQAGKNLWVPNWGAAGTLFHVSGVTISPDGSAVFAVDTRFRDAMKVWEVVAQNRESRRSPARQYIANNRRSGQRDDTGAFYDGRVFGKTQPVDLVSGLWVVFPVVAGRSGILQNIAISTSPASELAIQIWDREVTADWLNRVVGAWNTTGFYDHFNSNVNAWKDRGLIDHWGTFGQPAGYGHAAKNNPSTGMATGAVLTGDFKYDAGAPYYCHEDPVLWVAAQAGTDTTIQGGRILTLLLDDSAS